MKSRSRLEMTADVLSAILNGHDTTSPILRAANLNYSKFAGIAHDLSKSGLVALYENDGIPHYAITDRGKEFLNEYRKFEYVMSSYGMK